MCRGKSLSFASVPSDCKDPGEMTDIQIQEAIKNQTTII
jgi:hypothetical protein